MSPKSSILIPLYNHEKYIGECIESIQAQTETRWELIILDDGSVDNGFEVAQKYQKKDSRIRCERQKNEGTIATFNKLYRKSSGDFIFHLGSDDVWMPFFMEESLQEMESHPQCVASFSQFCTIDQNSSMISERGCRIHEDVAGASLVKELVVANFLGALTACMRRTALERCQPFARDVKRLEDWDLWLRLSMVGELRMRNRVSAKYRIHGQNQSFLHPFESVTNSLRMIEEHSKKVIEKHGLSPDVYGALLSRKGFFYKLLRQYEASIRCFEKKKKWFGLSVQEVSWFIESLLKSGQVLMAEQASAFLRNLKDRARKKDRIHLIDEECLRTTHGTERFCEAGQNVGTKEALSQPTEKRETASNATL